MSACSKCVFPYLPHFFSARRSILEEKSVATRRLHLGAMTSASIDPENEHLIQQAISALTRGKTIITIAHRLATVQNADQILVVEDGRIAEHGTHAELVQQDGLYRRFTTIREQAEGWHISAE